MDTLLDRVVLRVQRGENDLTLADRFRSFVVLIVKQIVIH